MLFGFERDCLLKGIRYFMGTNYFHSMKNLLITFCLVPIFLTAQNHQQFSFSGPVILIHGGAGGIERKYYTDEQIEEYDSALQAVLKVGFDMLTYNANGMDVVVECLTLLENDPHFNAGKGAVFNDQGEVELDASVMEIGRAHV